MAKVIITLKIMPEGTDTDLSALHKAILGKIKRTYGETETKVTEKPIAFGLKALEIMFVMDESRGSTDALEKDIAGLDGVNSVDVTDVRRSIG